MVSTASPQPRHRAGVTQRHLACSCPAMSVSLPSCRLSSPAQLSRGRLHTRSPSGSHQGVQTGWAGFRHGVALGTARAASEAWRQCCPMWLCPQQDQDWPELSGTALAEVSVWGTLLVVPRGFSVPVLITHLFWIRGGESACCSDAPCLHSVALELDFGQTCNFRMFEPKGPGAAPAACSHRQDMGRDAASGFVCMESHSKAFL